MSFFSLLLLALGLASDAAAAAASLGLRLPRVQIRHILSVMAWFGLFQGGMALLGSALGTAFGSYLEAWDHWIAFVLLAGLGTKMIVEAFRSEPESKVATQAPEPADPSAAQPFGFGTMLLLAFATSIDAWAVGVTLPMLGADVASACFLIGAVTALLSALGILAGRRFGDRLGRRVDVFGGVVLIAIGLKILLEHLGAIG